MKSVGTNAPSIDCSMDDFQVPKKRKSTDSVSGKENKPAPKKGRLSLKDKEKARSEDRFSEVTTDEELADLSKGYVPPNTEKNTGWAMRVFEQWQESRRARGNPVPEIFQKPYDCTLSLVSSICNHSLRVTGATSLYNGGVPEREIH